MPIINDLFSGKISLTTALGEIAKWDGQIIAKVESTLQADPAVTKAVSVAVSEASTLAVSGISWAGTALEGVGAEFVTELEALVTKYVPKIVGGAATGAPITAGALTLLGQLGELGKSAIGSLVTEAITAL